jgi:Ca2+-binding EF-hand superfamily protein
LLAIVSYCYFCQMDEMDMMIMQTASTERDDFKISKSFSYSSPPQQLAPPTSGHQDNPLKFHLVTTDEHGGYMLSVSPLRISHFRRILEASGIHALEAEIACNLILNKCTKMKLSKNAFDSAMKGLLSASSDGQILDEQTEHSLEGVFDSIFEAFDHEKNGAVSAIQVACGFTVLCRGKKSDKLEFAFEVLDKKKRGRLSKTDMSNYLQSFLTVLLTVAFSPSLENDSSNDILSTMSGTVCERSTVMLDRVVRAGASWAASLAFRDFDSESHDERTTMSFDDFASWYTRVGYSSIPWLELLDLQKWALVADVKT